MNYSEIAQHPEEFTQKELIEALKQADELYHNGEESFWTDAEYDAVRRFAHFQDPTHVYFTGTGSDVRGGKVKLPFEMGSLDQVEIGEIKKWVSDWSLDKESVVVSDKLDGTSCLIVYDNDGDLQIAYSRGNGTEGADITRHISKIHNVPHNVGTKMVVRAEVILPKTKFEVLKTKVKSRSGEVYKNARNMTAGLMNSKTNPDVVYESLHVVAYEVLTPELRKGYQFHMLQQAGFETAHFEEFVGRQLSDKMLADYLNVRRTLSDYEIDGVVIDVEDLDVRQKMNPTRDTLNPAYAIKYKVADASNLAIATVKGVTWNISKHGYLKPQVNIEPVELVGVTVQNATGFNAKFIWDNKIGKGAQVKITRSGDVIPFIVEVVKQARLPDMPSEDWTWNETEVDAILVDHHKSDEVVVQQVIDFFSSLEIPHLKEGTVRSMFDQNDFKDFQHAVLSMLNYNEDHWFSCIGANGVKVFEGLRKQLHNVPLHALMGALPFFGRGVGKRKMKKLEQAFGTRQLREIFFVDKADLIAVDGFNEKTIDKILAGEEAFNKFFAALPEYVTVEEMKAKEGGSLTGHKVCFTGFRDADLHAQVEAAGGEMQSGVSSKTTILVAKDPKGNSGKLKKARDNGTMVIGVDELRKML